MFRLPISFFDQRYVGDLVGRVDNNANVGVFWAGELAETILNIFVAAFYLILLIIYNPMLAAIAIAVEATNILIVKVATDVTSNISIKLQQDSGKLADAVCAGLSITSTLKASGAEAEYASRVLGYSAKTTEQEQRLSRLQQIIYAIPGALKMVANILLLLVGGTFSSGEILR